MAIDTQQREQLAQRLQQELDDAQQGIERLGAEMAGLSNDQLDNGTPTNHMGEQGTDVYEGERLHTIRIELEQRMTLVQDAQARMEDGSYGTCVRCGSEINPERLDALPFAAYCIECQEIVDNSQHVDGIKDDLQLSPQ